MKTEIEHCRHFDPYVGEQLFTCPKYYGYDHNNMDRIQYRDKCRDQCFKKTSFDCIYYED
jgi:hypothetical protein